MIEMEVRIKKTHPDAVIPTYSTDGSACFDLYSIERGYNGYLLRTGISFEVPDQHVMLVFSRSGHGFNNNTRLANCVGVIDSDYRGEVMVKLVRDDGDSFLIEEGDRIAQAMIIPYPKVGFVVSDGLSETERGTGGFGSTGK